MPPADSPEHADSTWIAGCERCRAHLLEDCARAGFTPKIGYTTDDMVLMQAFVAVGIRVTTIPELALRSHQAPGITVTELPDSARHAS